MVGNQDDFGIRNHVLLAFGPAVLDGLRHEFVTRPLSPGQILYGEGAPFTHAIFPHSGVISLQKTEPSGRVAEKASIGNEGFVGAALIYGDGNALSTSVVAVGGYGSWLDIRVLRELAKSSTAVMEALHRYAQALIFQLMESAACANVHSAEQRLARWLLTTCDRCNQRPIPVKQAVIAEVMSLRRATVSTIMKKFAANGLVDPGIGRIDVLDRNGLLNCSCGCYDRISQMFQGAKAS
jgi:CRP-like cAMP-binding protein